MSGNAFTGHVLGPCLCEPNAMDENGWPLPWSGIFVPAECPHHGGPRDSVVHGEQARRRYRNAHRDR